MAGHSVFDKFSNDLSRFRGVYRLLCAEAALAMIYDTCLGPAYLSALAGELKIGLSLVSVIAATPWIGASGQIIGAWAFERSDSVKCYVLRLATASRALWLIPLFLAGWWAYRDYPNVSSFPISLWFSITAICACMTALLGSASGSAWMFWMRHTVPPRFHGRFFGYRQRFTAIAFALASAASALLLDWSSGGYHYGIALVCLIGILCGALSVQLHSHVPDVPLRRPSNWKARSISEIVNEPLADPEFRKLLSFGAAYTGAMQLSSSYFPYYFTRELRIPMSSVAIWSGLANLGCFLTAGYWGRRTDSTGSPYEILWRTGHVISLSPLLYLSSDPSVIRVIAPIDYLISGVASCGFGLSQTKLLLHTGSKGGGAARFSVFAAACGISGALCALAGGQLARLLSHYGGFHALWVISSACRFGVLWLMCRPQGKSRLRIPAMLGH